MDTGHHANARILPGSAYLLHRPGERTGDRRPKQQRRVHHSIRQALRRGPRQRRGNGRRRRCRRLSRLDRHQGDYSARRLRGNRQYRSDQCQRRLEWIPFTAAPGNIYFVATNGSDSASGSYANPWRTLTYARDTIAPGDIVYAMNGVAQTTDDGQGWSSCLTIGANSGSPGQLKAMVVYPGATATIGNVSRTADGGCDTGVRAKGRRGELLGFCRIHDSRRWRRDATSWRDWLAHCRQRYELS